MKNRTSQGGFQRELLGSARVILPLSAPEPGVCWTTRHGSLAPGQRGRVKASTLPSSTVTLRLTLLNHRSALTGQRLGWVATARG